LSEANLPWTGELVAFVDYELTAPDQNVLINIGQSNPRFFVDYNRAKGMNVGTRAMADQVVIIRDEGEVSSSEGVQSWLEAGIMTDDEPIFRYQNFTNDTDLIIEVCDQVNGPLDAVRLSIYLDDGVQNSTCSAQEPDDGCEDDSREFFYIEMRDIWRKCIWLTRNLDVWGDELCVPGHDASRLCPETCGLCTDSCWDQTNVTFVVKDEERNCAWLSTKPAWKKRLCVENQQAYHICGETCNSCDPRH
jgi:hypothetical protein